MIRTAGKQEINTFERYSSPARLKTASRLFHACKVTFILATKHERGIGKDWYKNSTYKDGRREAKILSQTIKLMFVQAVLISDLML